MLGCVRKLAVFAAAISLLAESGAAVAVQATRAPAPATTIQAPNVDAWLTLSAMTVPSSSTSAAEAAQGEAVPVGWPHIAPLSVVLGTIATAIYILLDEDKDGRNGTGGMGPALGLKAQPLSPA